MEATLLSLDAISAALDSIRPHLHADGGNVEVVDFTDGGIVLVKWMGNCQGCAMSEMTLRAGIEQTLKSVFPSIVGVEVVNA
jgi:Fe-S cluster biogenesis protein NfuA